MTAVYSGLCTCLCVIYNEQAVATRWAARAWLMAQRAAAASQPSVIGLLRTVPSNWPTRCLRWLIAAKL